MGNWVWLLGVWEERRETRAASCKVVARLLQGICAYFLGYIAFGMFPTFDVSLEVTCSSKCLTWASLGSLGLMYTK